MKTINEKKMMLKRKMQEYFRTKNKDDFQKFLQDNEYSKVDRLAIFEEVSREYRQVTAYRIIPLPMKDVTDKKTREQLNEYMNDWLKSEGLTKEEMNEMMRQYPNILEEE
ncbi:MULTISPECIES: hypothetical protein [Bacillus]|uniref:Uncharacterized protein n=1 Tax=Bacillus cereus TaxID=1396 RepID=A0A9X6VVL1_BACCE|nr:MULTISPECIES: hypothetical protein [Bacillus cereus group]KXY51103.1 hypothetical protein AT268_31875 [Bacillus cereus]PES55641.1 hypothetical protein CN515_06440 [Bacillus cereus]PFA29441.1 hypothetical protein CN384_07000 [Bacillus thuringiensis]PFF46124.1 hypothetical protein CN357_22010 [Bacillus cereus]PFQ30207.1 hypothetical protein COK33_28565 [Bacillus cereus]